MKKLALLAASLLASPAMAAAPDPKADAARVDAVLDKGYPQLEALYKDIHQHPEIAFHEVRTAALLADRMRKLGFEVTEKVGGTGIVALYRNGAGPTVLVRTELDGLPLLEKTGLPYASRATQEIDGKVVPTMHGCGHDIHMSWWIATAQALLTMKDRWHGTLMFVAQPAEETVEGAKAMLKDDFFKRFPKPDYGFAAHVMPYPAGTVMLKEGPVTSAADAVKITFKGKGAHGSMPADSIDPIVMGAHFISDVQTVISRELTPGTFGVITVGTFHAGTVENIIPDSAELRLTLRSHDPEVRRQLLAGVRKTALAAASIAGAPEPDIAYLYGTAVTFNEVRLTDAVAQKLKIAMPGQVTVEPDYKPAGSGSEDYSEFVNAGIPSVFIGIGGSSQAVLDRAKTEGRKPPVNHSPFFAPDPEPSIRAGTKALTLSVLSVAGVD